MVSLGNDNINSGLAVDNVNLDVMRRGLYIATDGCQITYSFFIEICSGRK